jgi:hypothetical protein
MNSDERPFARPAIEDEPLHARSIWAQAVERLGLSPRAFGHRTRLAGLRTVPAKEPRRLLIQTTSAVAAMFIAGIAVGATLVMSKPRQIVAWSQQSVPVKIAP